MKILIIGATGQLGSELVALINGFSDKYDVLARGSRELDITNSNLVNEVILSERPEVVINCAAYTKVDDCEVNKDLAFRVNTLGSRNLAIACDKVDAKLVHVSTDYIFNGECEEDLREYDITGPTSVYGKTKLMGDEYVRDFCKRHFIIRVAWVYGKVGKNFVYTIMRLAKENGVVNVVDDQIGNPTYTKDLALHILKLIETEEYGIYNCTGSGRCSWYDFACKIINYAKIDCKVNAVTSKEFKTLDKRPKYSSLDNMMLRATMGDEMRSWEEALKEFIEDIKE